MGQLLGLSFFAVFILASVVAEWIASGRARRNIVQRMYVMGYSVADISRRWFPMSGPWAWRGGRSHRVFRVSVVDGSGSGREAFARVGGGWGGVVADDITIQWSDQGT